MNIAAYCRVSTEKDDQLNSLEAQKKFFEEYAVRNGHVLVGIYADEGISGTKIKNRREFLRLLNEARQGIFEMVVVKDISRFARNTVDFLNSIRQLKMLGIETVFLTSSQTVLGNSEFVLTIFGALAQEESANTSKRVKFGKKINAQKGRVPNLVYGYDKIKGDYFNLSVNEREADTVRRIFRLYITSGCGASKIAQVLNGDGIRTKRGCKWSQNAVARVLTNELYTGKVINGKEEIEDFLTGIRRERDESDWYVVAKPELRIVDDETFAAAARIISERQSAFSVRHERQSNKYLFSTLIKCACCGYSFRRTQKAYKNTYIKWECSGRSANGVDSCTNHTKIDEQGLVEAVAGYFVGILEGKADVIKCVEREFKRICRDEIGGAQSRGDVSERLGKAVKARQKYIELYGEDLISKDELHEKVNLLNREIERLEGELAAGGLAAGGVLAGFSDTENLLPMEYMTNAQLKRFVRRIEVDECGNAEVCFREL